jgi:CubicO group peptidase (beta-lactamase class C family)
LDIDGRDLVLRLDVESPLGINEVVADLEQGAPGTVLVYGSSVAYERGDAGSGGWTQTPVLQSETGSDPWSLTGEYVVYAVLPEGALTATAVLRDGTTSPLATAAAPWAPDRHVAVALVTAPVEPSNKPFDGLAAEDLPVRDVVFGSADS